MSSDVHGLPAKWRQEADDDLDSVTSWKLARRRCADELEAALRQSGEAVATIHRDGYWTHEPGRDPFDRFGPNANSSGLKVYAAPPATSGLVEALREDTRSKTVEWNPIETAPRGNSIPLLIARFNGDGTMQSFDYNASWESESESWELPQVYWYWQSEHGNVEDPSHWAYQPEGFDKIDALANWSDK